MSNYTLKLRHQGTLEVHEIHALDNHFGHRIYGYKLPNHLIVKENDLEILYYPLEEDLCEQLAKGDL